MAKVLLQRVRITVEDGASGPVQHLTDTFGKLGDTLKERFVITAGDAEQAVRALTQVIVSSITAAAEQETAVKALGAALANLAPGAERGVAALVAQADALQKVTKFSDDAVISAQAMLATFGVAPEKIAAATQASVNLSAALGIDLNSAAVQVGGTFNGVTRGLERVVPGLKSLSDAALKAGGAVDVMNEALAGRAAAAADTLEGRLTILTNSLGEVKQTIGDVVVKSGEVNGVLTAAAGATDIWNAALKTTLPVVKELVIEQSSLLSTMRDIAKLLALLKEAYDAVTKPAESLGMTMDQLGMTMANLTALQERNIRVNGQYAAGLDEVGAIAKELGITLERDLIAKREHEAELYQRLAELGRLGIDVRIAEKDSIAQLGASLDGVNKVRATGIDLASREIAVQGELARAVVFTSQAFDALARSQGVSAATDAAVAAGGRTILGGTRVLLPGGGSRLTEPFPAGSINGGKFG